MRVEKNKGLNYEEPLLWEYAQGGGSGVDLPAPAGNELCTGVEKRSDIGLPDLSEPEVLRHYVRMSTWNYSIDHGFFPLGSCTMKHNPRLNEKMARLPGFANIHPLQPVSTVQGALELIYELQDWLGKLTGLPGVCLAPCAGAHGELAGMMTIRRAHECQGQIAKRRIILTPDSSHGTNPATAVMCGFEVRSISTRDTGRLGVQDFKEALYKSDPEGRDVAGMMVTNPNTCGLFERDICKIADLLHEAGGYFYCDGANFNALVGNVRPADFGVDVMHINLHKTFSTPHGGGGPGSGPICCTQELARYMPVPVSVKDGDYYRFETAEDRPDTLGALKAFAGQFGIFVRALAYMKSMGADGLAQASRDAVLNANYLLARLREDYHVPFEGVCMHECLLSDKNQKEFDVTTLDIAKTLVEKGYHPMTVYFPLILQGAMLVEPTETESKSSIDAFVQAMKEISLKAREGGREDMQAMPVSTPRRRLDEVRAARKPVLKYGDNI